MDDADFTRHVARVDHAHHDGNGNMARARELQLRANRVTRVVLSFGFPGALREVMRVLSLDCGEPRLPNLSLPAEERERLRAELEAAGLAELAAL